MKGKIKFYNTSKGYGFINTENSKEYFFHISDVSTNIDIASGMECEFEIGENFKGECAKHVKIVSKAPNKFISFGDVRLKASNIKSYGIGNGTNTLYYKKTFREKDVSKKERLFYGSLAAIKSLADMDPLGAIAAGGIAAETKKTTVPDGKIRITKSEFDMLNSDITDYEYANENYLYVTTYQNDNYRFFKSDIDFEIEDKLNELVIF